MTSVEIMRLLTSAIWIAILIVFRKPARRVAAWSHDLEPWEALMGATWLLAGNRLTYAAVGQFIPGDANATNVCQVYALIAGTLMLLTGTWSLRVHRS